MKAWNACTKAAGLGSIPNALQTYMVFINCIVMYEHISSCAEGYALQFQQMCYAAKDQIVLPGEPVDGAVALELPDCSDPVDETQPHIVSAGFNTLHALVQKKQRYTLEDEVLRGWLEVKKCQLGTRMLSLVYY